MLQSQPKVGLRGHRQPRLTVERNGTCFVQYDKVGVSVQSHSGLLRGSVTQCKSMTAAYPILLCCMISYCTDHVWVL